MGYVDSCMYIRNAPVVVTVLGCMNGIVLMGQDIWTCGGACTAV
jgi:hypothetical protein